LKELKDETKAKHGTAIEQSYGRGGGAGDSEGVQTSGKTTTGDRQCPTSRVVAAAKDQT